MKKSLLIKASLAAGAVVVCALIFGFQKPKDKGEASAPSVKTVQATVGSGEEDVMSPGTIVPANTVVVSVPPSPPDETFAAIVDKVLVDVGDRVEKGQLLATLDSTEMQNLLIQAESKRAEAEKQYELVKTLYRPEQIEVQRLQVSEDEKNVDEAKAHLQLLIDGNRPEMIALARAAVDEQKTILKQLQAENERSHILYSKDLISKSDIEKNDEDVAAQVDKVAEAEAQLKIDQLGSRDEEVASARESVNKLAAARDKDKEELKVMQLGSRREAIDAARQAYLLADSAVKMQEQVLQHQFIRAPCAGVIIERNVSPGEAAGPVPAAHSDRTSPLINNIEGLFEIADDKKVEFMANVDQQFFSSVHPDQTATLTIEALPGKTFTAKITRIQPLVSPIERNIPGNSNPTTPLTFVVWADVPNGDKLLIPGQTGIITANKKEVGLEVPQAAVNPMTLGEGEVFVVKDGVAHLKTVKYQGKPDGQARVLSGLEAGDEVVVTNTLQLRDGQHVLPTPAGADDLTTRARGL
jgi:RND family efflux transporter MFP subunit